MDTERKALTLLGIGAIAAGTAFPKAAEASSPQNLLLEPNTNNVLNVGPIENLNPRLESRELREIQNALVLIDWTWQLPENSSFTEEGIVTNLSEAQVDELALNPLYAQMLQRNVQVGAAFIQGGILQDPDFNTVVSYYVDDQRNMHVSSYLSFEDGDQTGIIVEDIDPEKDFQAYIERQGVESFSIGRTPEGRPVMVYQNPNEEPGMFALSFGDDAAADVAGIVPLAPGDAQVATEYTFPPLVNATNGSANVRRTASTDGEDIGDITTLEPRLVAGVVTGQDNYEWYGFVGGGFSRTDVVSSTPIRVAGQEVVIEPTAVPDQTVLVENPPFVGDPLTAADFGDSAESPWSEYGVTETEYNESRQTAFNILPEEIQQMVENGEAVYNHGIRGFVNSRNQVYRPHMGTENSDWLDQWGRTTVTTSDGRIVVILFEGSDADMQTRDSFGASPFRRFSPNSLWTERVQRFLAEEDSSEFPDVLIINIVPDLPNVYGRDEDDSGEMGYEIARPIFTVGSDRTPSVGSSSEFLDSNVLQIRSYIFLDHQINGSDEITDRMLNGLMGQYIYFGNEGGNSPFARLNDSRHVYDTINRYFPSTDRLFDVFPVSPSPSS